MSIGICGLLVVRVTGIRQIFSGIVLIFPMTISTFPVTVFRQSTQYVKDNRTCIHHRNTLNYTSVKQMNDRMRKLYYPSEGTEISSLQPCHHVSRVLRLDTSGFCADVYCGF